MIHVTGLVLAVVLVGGETWVSLPRNGERQAATFRFRVARVECLMDAAGNGSCGDWRFTAVTPHGDFITRAFALHHDGHLVIAYEFTDDETVGSAVIAIAESSPLAIWRAEINDGNLGHPAVRGLHAYVTAAGLVAKLDLRSGTFVWKRDD